MDAFHKVPFYFTFCCYSVFRKKIASFASTRNPRDAEIVLFLRPLAPFGFFKPFGESFDRRSNVFRKVYRCHSHTVSTVSRGTMSRWFIWPRDYIFFSSRAFVKPSTLSECLCSGSITIACPDARRASQSSRLFRRLPPSPCGQ